MSELQFIENLRARFRTQSPFVPLAIGDDCALLDMCGHKNLLVTVDTLMDGVHFKVGEATPLQIGHKALAVNLSDIAAMGGTAIAAVVAVALPRRQANLPEFAAGLMEGIANLAAKFNVAIVGGDTNSWNNPLAITITALGVPHAKGAVRRGGAKPGDAILVTGTLGGSIGGRHLDFIPRLAEARALLDRYDLHSMIDLSDGLATDLRHICRESGCGAVLEREVIPITPALTASCGREVALTRALSEGEDFELCFTVDLQTARCILAEGGDFPGVPVTMVGRCIAQQGLFIEGADRTMTPLELKGYEHGF